MPFQFHKFLKFDHIKVIDVSWNVYVIEGILKCIFSNSCHFLTPLKVSRVISRIPILYIDILS